MVRLKRRTAGLDVGSVRAQLRAVNLSDNDLVVMRITDAPPQYLEQAREVLAEAIARMDVKAIGIVTDKEIEPFVVAKVPEEFWLNSAIDEMETLRAIVARRQPVSERKTTRNPTDTFPPRAAIEAMSDDELRAQFEKDCAFSSCRKRSKRVDRNYCRGHEAVLRELDRRAKPTAPP